MKNLMQNLSHSAEHRSADIMIRTLQLQTARTSSENTVKAWEQNGQMMDAMYILNMKMIRLKTSMHMKKMKKMQ